MHQDISNLPGAIQQRVAGAQPRTVTLGLSGATVTVFELDQQPILFVKEAPISTSPDPGLSVKAEFEKLSWLQGKIVVPEVVHFETFSNREILATLPLAGAPLCNLKDPSQNRAAVSSLAEAIKGLHALPVTSCPFNQSLDEKLRQAEENVRRGLVRTDLLEPEYQGLSPSRLFERLVAHRPSGKEDLVVAHGDSCLPNIFVDGTRFSGMLDLGRLGVADYHQDIAALTSSMLSAQNSAWGAPLVERLYGEYGKPINPEKVAFYQLLDEFF